MGRRHMLVVLRESIEESTVAIVRWGGTSPAEFKPKLWEAVMRWLRMEGSPAIHGSFNVGDLAQWTSNEDLRRLLEGVDIHNLEVDVYCDENAVPWTFDESFDEPRPPAASGRSDRSNAFIERAFQAQIDSLRDKAKSPENEE